MSSKTVWVECRLGESGLPCFFPGHNLFHAKAKSVQFFESLSIPVQEVEMKEYTPRKKIVTERKRKRLRAKRLIETR